MADKKGDALATQGTSGYAIIDAPDAKETMLAAFDQLGLSNFQLNRVKIPPGGVTAWEVESLEGTAVHQHLDVVILTLRGKQKSWWATSMDEGGSGSPPSCASTDARTGFGVNTLDADATPGQHACAECAWNQFGSARNGGQGKDCKDYSLLFFFTEGSRIPSLLIVPATSLKGLQGYVLKLIDAGKRMESVVTRLGLKKTQSQAGITYSVLDLSWQSDLDADAAASMREVADEFRRRISDFDAYAETSEE